MKKNTQTFKSYKESVDRWFKKLYACDSKALMISDEEIREAMNDGSDPREYVDWYGEKYDLFRNDNSFFA